MIDLLFFLGEIEENKFCGFSPDFFRRAVDTITPQILYERSHNYGLV